MLTYSGLNLLKVPSKVILSSLGYFCTLMYTQIYNDISLYSCKLLYTYYSKPTILCIPNNSDLHTVKQILSTGKIQHIYAIHNIFICPLH